jgi:ABC-type glycerol-3-phosphate transport system permease component
MRPKIYVMERVEKLIIWNRFAVAHVFIRSTAPKAAPSEVQDKKGRQYMQNAMQVMFSSNFFFVLPVTSNI